MSTEKITSASKAESSFRKAMFVYVFFFIVVLAFSILISFNLIFKVQMPELQSFNFSLHNKLIFDDSFRGTNPESNLTVAYLSDFTCPACIEQYPALKQLMALHPEANFLFKHVVNTEDEDAFFAAKAFECAKVQGQGYELADFLFTNRFKQSDIYDYLETLDVNLQYFVECMNSSTIEKIIQADLNHAGFLQIRGTPTIFINGIRVEGAHSFEVLDELIKNDEALEVEEDAQNEN
jgi:predicted DsbA family dithiol-disulfide isomerase